MKQHSEGEVASILPQTEPAGIQEDISNTLRSDVLIGIPAYNEEVAIGSIVLLARQYGNVLVVDDGSNDNTADIAQAAGAMVIEHQENRRKGGALKTILRHAKGVGCDALVLLDGDGQHLPQDIPEVIQPIVEDDADVVIGSRYLRGQAHKETPFYRRIGQRTLDLLTQVSTGLELTDSQSGFRALSPEAIETVTLESEGYGVESEMLAVSAENDLSVMEVPIDVRYEGISNQMNPVKHGASVILSIVSYLSKTHPLMIFGIPGLLLIIFSTFYGVSSLLSLEESTAALHLVIVELVTIFGIIAIMYGITLHQMRKIKDQLP